MPTTLHQWGTHMRSSSADSAQKNKRVLSTRFDCIALQDSEPDGCQAVQLAMAPA